MSELSYAITELKRCGEALIGISESLSSLFSSHDDPEVAEQPNTDNHLPEDKPVTLETVRAVLAEKSRAGHTDKVRELLEKHGTPKLSEIDPSEYPALLAEAEVLGNE
ncbi:DNA ligase [Brevibacillus reuszeri]|nr:DNA ligase [Brevibacillus reuszeri]MED1856289.1 rRNA biogenesis protein rrp5 [Brevibacillus reuszeri]